MVWWSFIPKPRDIWSFVRNLSTFRRGTLVRRCFISFSVFWLASKLTKFVRNLYVLSACGGLRIKQEPKRCRIFSATFALSPQLPTTNTLQSVSSNLRFSTNWHTAINTRESSAPPSRVLPNSSKLSRYTRQGADLVMFSVRVLNLFSKAPGASPQ